MTIRLRTAFFIIFGIVSLWFLYIERDIITPFLLAAIFAYIVNPVINFFSNKIKLPRTASVVVIYMLIMGIFIYIATLLTSRIIEEVSYFSKNIGAFRETTQAQLNLLPDFIRPYVSDIITSIENIRITPSFSILNFFPQAFNGVINFFIFVVSGFYFLREGKGMFDKILNLVPNDYKIELEILFRKINAVLSEYLRGQLLLIIIMSVILFIPLEILGVRFAFLLSVFSGIAELVPIIGPVIAAAVAAAFVFFSETSSFGFNPIQVALIVLAVYFITRQIQDYFITPHIIGKIVKIHPLLILFAVIAGENTGGILGIFLAVPLAAVVKILFEFSRDKINEKSES